MSPENGRSQTPNPETTGREELIQDVVVTSLSTCSITSKWDLNVLEKLATDYISALTSIDNKCGGRWRNVRVITEEILDNPSITYVVPAGTPHEPYLNLESITNKNYLEGVDRSRLGVKLSFTAAIGLITENKSPRELRILKGKKPDRMGVKNVARNSRSTHGNHSASEH